MDAAVARLAALPGTALLARSGAYRTAPDGPVADQPWFVNLAVTLATELTLEDLGTACREIETVLGRDRTREIPWGPRPVDIDVVAAGSANEMSPPKGKLDERPFVIVPAAEIAPEVAIGGVTLRARAETADRAGMTQLDWRSA
jgi:2-amino-4-hydroxy-6-hydroxymethyldihydropteridine diphosphokinase